MGAAALHYLGYKDGRLCNLDLLTIAEQLHAIITPLLRRQGVVIEMMSFDFNGISGHIATILSPVEQQR